MVIAKVFNRPIKFPQDYPQYIRQRCLRFPLNTADGAKDTD